MPFDWTTIDTTGGRYALLGQLADILAALAAVQTFLGVATTAAAKAKIFPDFIANTDAALKAERPFLVLELPNGSARPILAGGSRAFLGPPASAVRVLAEQPIALANQAADKQHVAQAAFTNALDDILDALADVSGQNTNPVFTLTQPEPGPVRSSEDVETSGAYYFHDSFTLNLNP